MLFMQNQLIPLPVTTTINTTEQKGPHVAGKYVCNPTEKGCHIDRTRQPDSGGFHPRCGFLLFTLQERRKF
ncbi:hypothetical protein C9Z24_15280 [Escherichia coli]|nr:hypothetical protein C9Z24_15280 [Escherichia coli]